MKLMLYIEIIEKKLEQYGISAEIWYTNDNRVCVDIHWGDWKHDHLLCDHLICGLPFVKKVDVCITEEDGSDSYSATHQYTIAA